MRKLEKQVSQQLPAFLPLYRKMSCKMTELTAKDRMAIDSDEIMAIRDERRNCKIICACLNSATKIAEACAKATAVAKSCKAEDISKVIEALRSEKTEFIKNLRALPNEISEAFGAIVNCKRMTALPKDLTNADHIYDILIDENRECDRELLATAFFERMLKLASS
ncbi:MAG: hypothetical protein JSS30_01570 [Verrucomicrobia bacterium]|nr:hypothetical protein [Verrucomicrobiota bacterium]